MASSPPIWEGDVQALLAACLPCHGAEGDAPRLDRFETLAACREDGEGWIRPGDPNSPLLVALTRDDHKSILSPEAQSKLRDWVVVGRGVFRSAVAHPPGFALADNPASHLAVLRAAGFAPLLDPSRDDACARCHGVEPEQGGAVACSTCHPKSVNACDTCHGANDDPRPRKSPCGEGSTRPSPVGAHAAHSETSRRPQLPGVPCASCHDVPDSVGAPGHLADGSPGAEVRFSPTQNPNAVWDPTTQTCAGVACHADKEQTWTRTASVSNRCDTCHGNPPEDHANDRCETCHAGAFANGRLRADRHIDGRLEVPTACDGCHGNPPPPGLGGSLGAHATHLAASAFRGPIACATCHIVPTNRDDVGHIDTDLPVEVVLTTDAATGGGAVSAMYDPVTRTCQTACHGVNLDGALPASPAWDGGATPVCGDCHALPPTTVRNGAGMHLPTGPADCGACHLDLMRAPITDPSWNLTPAGRGVHINGCVNLVDGCRQ